MAALFKGAISFGLVYIPVSLYPATQSENSFTFNQLHKSDKSRIRYKKVCSSCGKEVGMEDIVRGFEYEKGKYVVIEDEEIEKIKSAKDKSITILSFVSLEEISPVYFDRAYYIVPQKGGGKALELLRQAMKNKNRAAIGKCVFQSAEKMLVLIPQEEGMLIKTLHYFEDLKEVPVDYERPKIATEELEIAEKLISGMEKPFAPQSYKNEFREKLKKLIESKVEGKQVFSPKEEGPQQVLDLMEALRASVKSLPAKGKTPPQNRRKKTARKEA